MDLGLASYYMASWGLHKQKIAGMLSEKLCIY